jgi:hypothetical protein
MNTGAAEHAGRDASDQPQALEGTSKSGIEDSVLPSLAGTIGYGVLALMPLGCGSKHAIGSRSGSKE